MARDDGPDIELDASPGGLTLFLDRLVRATGMSPPLALGIVFRSLAAIFGVVTLHFVTRNLSPTLQGYYYTFGSLAQFTWLVDLGLGILILEFASHESAHLSFGRHGEIQGPARAVARLASLGRFSLGYFALFSLLLVASLQLAGHWLFPSAGSGVNWQAPWTLLCLLIACDLILGVFISLLEGSNHLMFVYAYRLARLLGGLALWFFLAHGYGLMSVPLNLVVSLTITVIFLAVGRRRFVLGIFRRVPGETGLSWKSEIMPLQWRLAISQISSFVTYSLLVPVTFKFAGPVPAGQMGMSWTIVEAATGIALLWPNVKFPTMGALAARRDWPALDRTALKLGVQIAVLGALGVTALLGLAALLRVYYAPIGGRILPTLPFALLATAIIPKLIQSVMVAYLRAHKREPFVIMMLASIPIIVGLLVAGAVLNGALGVAASYWASMTLFLLPATLIILVNRRKDWHATARTDLHTP